MADAIIFSRKIMVSSTCCFLSFAMRWMTQAYPPNRADPNVQMYVVTMVTVIFLIKPENPEANFLLQDELHPALH